MPNKTDPAAHAPQRQRVRRGSAEDHQDLREQIVAAAFVVQERDGIEALSMRALAAELGLSPMALYRYFASKSELLNAMLRSVLAAVGNELANATTRGGTARARLRASIEAAIRYWEAHPGHFRLVFMTPETMAAGPDVEMDRTPEFQKSLDISLGIVEDLIAEVGGNPRRALLARDLRASLIIGYLHARIVNTRFPWSDFDALRQCTIDTIALGVENCVRKTK